MYDIMKVSFARFFMLLKMEDKFKGCCDVIPSLHTYYTAPDCDKLDHLLLSPRASFDVCDNEWWFPVM